MLDPSSATRVQVCGRLVVVHDGRRLETTLPSRQGRALFVFMVVHRDRQVGRAELVEALWPDGAPPAADQALRSLLSKLRRALGAGMVAGRDDPHLTLPAGAYVDLEAAAERLHAAESAVRMSDWHRAWAPARAALHTASRGFLAGYEAPWIDDVRRSLDDMRVRALECVAVTGLALGGPELAAAERAGRSLVAAAPFRESGYAHLMRALAAQENVAEALLVHERLRCLLRDELGIPPSAAVQELHGALLRSRPEGAQSSPASARE
jgi:DNA-binding SARP family transcriptional activator